MGLFSIFSKNKQDSTAQDSGRFSRDDDDFRQQARTKRASYANEAGAGGSRRSRSGGDPMLPEKKRARRRLVGAVALALAAAVGLPMLLDSEPRPLAGDIAIQIPSKEKAPALPMPSAPVAAADSVDQDEEIIAPPPLDASAPVAGMPPPVKTVDTARTMPDDEPELPDARRAAPEPKPAERKPEPKHEAKPEAKPETKPERKIADKPAEKPADKPAPKKVEDKPAAVRPKDSDAARALALLEGKSDVKPAEKAEPAEKKPEASQRYVVQVAALATEEKVAELQARLRAAGISSTARKAGALIKVQVGPFGSREEAEKTRARLSGLGIGGFLVPV